MFFTGSIILLVFGYSTNDTLAVILGYLFLLVHVQIRVWKKPKVVIAGPHCFLCKSRAYTVSRVMDKYFLSPTGTFYNLKIYRHTCRQCGFIWFVRYKNDYSAR